jgi:hypothetical protein
LTVALPRALRVTAASLAALAGLASGGYAAGQWYVGRTLDSAAREDVRTVGQDLATLIHLRAGKVQEAIASLESREAP